MFEKKTDTNPAPHAAGQSDHGTTHGDHGHGHDVGHDHDAPHAVPLSVLGGVFGLLMVLTVLTVAATKVDLGEVNIWIALGIALVKAVFVALYFMHLRWDSPFNGLVLASSLAFVVLFIGITLMDTREYQPIIERYTIEQTKTAP